MRRSVDIDFEFERMPTLANLVRAIGENDIEPCSGGVLWVTSNGDHDWERREPSECRAVMLEMTRTLARNETVGFGITWRSAERRGSLLLMPQFKSISFTPDFDTLTNGTGPGSTGLGWYVDTLSSALVSLNPTSIVARNAP